MTADVRRPALHLAAPEAHAPPHERERTLADALLAVAARVNTIDQDVLDVKLALIRIESNLTRVAAGHGPMAQYNPDLTPAGGIRIEPQHWQAIQQRISEQEHKLELAKAETAGADKALGKLKSRILFFVAIATPTGGLVGWLLAHLLHGT